MRTFPQLAGGITAVASGADRLDPPDGEDDDWSQRSKGGIHAGSSDASGTVRSGSQQAQPYGGQSPLPPARLRSSPNTAPNLEHRPPTLHGAGGVPTAASAPPTTSYLLRCLPSPLQRLGMIIFDFLFLGSIIDSDDYIQRMRKVALGILLLGCVSQAVSFFSVWSISTPIMNVYLLTTVLIPTAVSSIGGFIYCRVQKSAPDWMFATVLLTAITARCFLAPTNRTIDMEPASFGYFMVVLCTRMPYGVKLAAFFMTVFLLVINTLVMQFPSIAAVIAIPGVGEGSEVANAIKHVLAMRCVFFFKSIGFYLIVRHFFHLLSSRDAAVALCRELAERLQVYDTEGAMSMLQNVTRWDHNNLSTHHQQDGDNGSVRIDVLTPSLSVDPSLLRAFEGIVRNLERYRPFLPNYLFEHAEERVSEEEGGGTSVGEHTDGDGYRNSKNSNDGPVKDIRNNNIIGRHHRRQHRMDESERVGEAEDVHSRQSPPRSSITSASAPHALLPHTGATPPPFRPSALLITSSSSVRSSLFPSLSDALPLGLMNGLQQPKNRRSAVEGTEEHAMMPSRSPTHPFAVPQSMEPSSHGNNNDTSISSAVIMTNAATTTNPAAGSAPLVSLFMDPITPTSTSRGFSRDNGYHGNTHNVSASYDHPNAGGSNATVNCQGWQCSNVDGHGGFFPVPQQQLVAARLRASPSATGSPMDSVSAMDAAANGTQRGGGGGGGKSRVPPVRPYSPLRVASPLLTLTVSTPVVSVCVMSVERNISNRSDYETGFMWNGFIGAVNDVAQSTGASLHSFHGDRLVATWNGTKRVSRPETRACQFALRVRSVVAGHSALRAAFQLSSMVATRHAECSFAGDARLRLFACSSPELWRHVYAGLDRIEHHHIDVVDRITKEAAATDVAFGAGALLRSSIDHSSSHPEHDLNSRCLYEVLHEGADDGRDEDVNNWMYAAGNEGNPIKYDPLIVAMELCALGRPIDAYNLLRPFLSQEGKALRPRTPAEAELLGTILQEYTDALAAGGTMASNATVQAVE